MGVAILGGALTTVLASCMLLLCTIKIFFRFGVVLSINMTISIVFTLFLFSSIMLVLGPTGTWGNAHALVVNLAKRWFPRQCGTNAAHSNAESDSEGDE
jgi:hypothetical protein